MECWSYSDYQRAVSSAVEQGLHELGFTSDQAIGYAHQDLELRLGSHPDEVGLAMTALGSIAATRADPTMYPSNGDFVGELRSAYSSTALEAALQRLDEPDHEAFKQDVSVVKAAFQI